MFVDCFVALLLAMTKGMGVFVNYFVLLAMTRGVNGGDFFFSVNE